MISTTHNDYQKNSKDIKDTQQYNKLGSAVKKDIKNYSLAVKNQEYITPDIIKISLTLVDKSLKLPTITAGQFAMLRISNRQDLLLRRPLAIVSSQCDGLEFVYRVKGEGTASLATLKSGDIVDVLLPLGKGFDIKRYKKILLVAGGLGLAGVAALPVLTNKEYIVLAGFKNSAEANLIKILAQCTNITNTIIMTEDGSSGIKGVVTDCLAKIIKDNCVDAICVCGSDALSKAVACSDRYDNAGKLIPTFVSLEQRMACGVGACMGCVMDINNKKMRVCLGPVFDVMEVNFE